MPSNRPGLSGAAVVDIYILHPSTSFSIAKGNRGLGTAVTTITFALIAGLVSTGWCANLADSARERAAATATEARNQETRVDEETKKAKRNALKAEQQHRRAEALRFVVKSQQYQESHPARSLLLAVEAAQKTRRKAEPMLPEVRQQLYELIGKIGGRVLQNESSGSKPIWLVDGRIVYSTDFDAARPGIFVDNSGQQQRIYNESALSMAASRNSEWLVASESKGTTSVWHLTAPDIAKSKTKLWHLSHLLGFSESSDRFFASKSGQGLRVWQITDGNWELVFKIVDDSIDSSNPQLQASPDGRWLFTGTVLWDLRNKKPKKMNVEEGVNQTRKRVTSSAFSNDSQWLAVGGFGFCQLWRLQDNELTEPFANLVDENVNKFSSHETKVICFDSDSGNLITSSGFGTGTTDVWKLNPQKNPIKQVSLPHIVDEAVFTPNERLVTLTRSGDLHFRRQNGVLRIWHLSDRNHLGESEPRLIGSTVPVSSFEVSPTSETVLTLDESGKIRMWHIDDHSIHDEAIEFYGHDKSSSTSMSFSRDGKQLISDTEGSNASPARVWNLEQPTTNKIPAKSQSNTIFRFQTPWVILTDQSNQWTTSLWNIETNEVQSFQTNRAFEQKHRWLAANGRLWDLGSPTPLVHPVIEFENPVSSYRFSVSGRFLAVRYRNRGGVSVYELTPNNEARRLLHKAGRFSSAFGFSTDEKSFFGFDSDKNRLGTWSLESSLERFHVADRIPSLDFDDIRIARNNIIAQANRDVLLWNISPEFKSQEPVVLRNQQILAFSNAGQLLLTKDGHNELSLFNLSSDDMQSSRLKLNTDQVQGRYIGRFTDNGERLIVTREGLNPTCMVWDTSETEIDARPGTYPMDRYINRGVVSPRGKWLASGYNSNEIWLLNTDKDVSDQNPIILTGHQPAVCLFLFSNCERWLFTAEGADKGRLWDLSARDVQASGIELPGGCSNAVFSKDDSHLATLTKDSIMLWNLPEEELVRRAIQLAGRQFTKTERIIFGLN